MVSMTALGDRLSKPDPSQDRATPGTGTADRWVARLGPEERSASLSADDRLLGQLDGQLAATGSSLAAAYHLGFAALSHVTAAGMISPDIDSLF